MRDWQFSPMLWNLGFNEFVSAMNEFGGVPTPIGNIACLAFADDATFIAESDVMMQALCFKASVIAERNRLEFKATGSSYFVAGK